MWGCLVYMYGQRGGTRTGAAREVPNSREIFAGLYDEFMPKVFRYIHCKVNDEQLTEDLTSMVFEKALVNFASYSRDKAAFSTWIFSIARNTVIDHYRTAARRQHVPLDEAEDTPSGEPSPEEQSEQRAEKECLLRCLGGLSQPDREIIGLKFGAELNNREIARMLGLSESNVGVRLFRAVKKLREGFDDSWNG